MILAFKPVLYFHTLRYLKLGQIYWRIWYRFIRPCVDVSPRPTLRSLSGQWVIPARRRQSIEDGNEFTLLNVAGRLSEVGWDGPQREKLWRYNQHYFDDMNSVNSKARSEWHLGIVNRWVQENTPGQGTGWEPYPTSLRIVNWIKWHLANHLLNDDCLQSLAIQTRWLSKRIEWHILGNHLFANAKALVFAGHFFEGPEAKKWLDIGLEIIACELPEQVLPDGGNFERSPMYHSIFLEDILDLINLVEAYPSIVGKEHLKEWRATAIRMLRWLEKMCHPDGEIAFFNDAAMGVAPSPKELKMYAKYLDLSVDQFDSRSNNITVSRFEDSGYLRIEAMYACLFLDVAHIGPDYLPGHAHADTLSFEFSLFGERVFVNGGTSQYGNGPLRLEERSTAAHNTVEVNDENSSEVWSGFRVARRAHPIGLEIAQSNETVVVTCGHDGYMRLPGRPAHKRSWQLSQGKLIVRDRIDGVFKTAIARFHFHPVLRVNSIDCGIYSVRLSDSGQEIQINVLDGVAELEQSFFAPEFGVRLSRQCLAVRFESNNEIAVEVSWSNNE